jgi:hypothetical protein
MSLWISSTQEIERRLPPPPGSGRSFYAYVLVGLVGLALGLILGQIVLENRGGRSRIQWPEPTLPHPRTLPQ